MTDIDSTPDVPLKQCTKCGERKPATSEHWYRNRGRSDGWNGECRACTLKRLGLSGTRNTARTLPEAPQGYKYCRWCGELKPLVEFFRQPRNTDGIASWCRDCCHQKYEERARKLGVEPKKIRVRDELKHCARCDQWLPNTKEFYSSKTSAYCKPCSLDYQREKRREQGIGPVPQRRQGDQKQCSHCERWFPATLEHFGNNKRQSDGLHYWCKECESKHYHENKERLKPNKQAADKRWRKDNRQKITAGQREWAKKYPEKAKRLKRVATNRRRARKEGLLDTFTSDDYKRMTEYWHGCCAVCGRQLNDLFGEHKAAIDHWIPIAKNGPTTPDNIVPLCHGVGGCNNSKSGKFPEEWLTEKFGKRKAKYVLDRIQTYFEWVRANN